jgi:hypothetical protein
MGRRCGKGEFTWKNGDTYSGGFLRNNFHGEGTFKWADGREYTGKWSYNKFHGVSLSYLERI